MFCLLFYLPSEQLNKIQPNQQRQCETLCLFFDQLTLNAYLDKTTIKMRSFQKSFNLIPVLLKLCPLQELKRTLWQDSPNFYVQKYLKLFNLLLLEIFETVQPSSSKNIGNCPTFYFQKYLKLLNLLLLEIFQTVQPSTSINI